MRTLAIRAASVLLAAQAAVAQDIGTNYCVSTPAYLGGPVLISAQGSTIAADEDVTLFLHDGRPFNPCLLWYGTAQVQFPWGNGFRCVGGTNVRIQPPALFDADGVIERQLNFDAPYAKSITSGATLHFQGWYRDHAPGGAGFNTSDGLTITFE